MIERNWTDAQKAAIDYRDGNLLLSAAAGSGKTATLTQRIIELIEKDGADLDRMLIVTFTKAAASELRSRLAGALSETAAKNPEDRHIIRQISALESAQISTMHSFFNTELKPYAARLGLPPDFRTLDSSETAVLLSDSMSQCIASCFEAGGEEAECFKRLADCISGAKNEDGLDKALLKIRDDLYCRGIDSSKLRENAKKTADSCKEPFNTGCFEGVRRRMRAVSRCCKERFDEVIAALKTTENPGGDIEVALSCADAAERLGYAADAGYAEAYAFFAGFSLPDMSRKKQSDDAAEWHLELSKLKKDFTTEKKGFEGCFASSPEEMELICLENAWRIDTLAWVLESFEKLYGEAKRERGAIDFNDMEQLALTLFVSPDGTPTEQAKAAGEKFDYIFIDEYQDTNETQDKIFRAVASNTSRFMVGDVKQSIYGFRGACPDIFTDYRRRWSEGNGGNAVFMSENFRCGEGIIDFSNLVSRHIFSTGATPFDAADELVFSKKYDGDTPPVYRPAQLCLVEKPEDSDGENREAQYVADRIAALLSGETLDSGSPVRARDIAILLRSSTRAEDYARALAERGIPVSNEISENFFAYGEVMLIICLLRSADNPLRDIYLAGAMKSPLFGFTLEELVRIKSSAGDMPLWYAVRGYGADGGDEELRLKCSRFAVKLELWREASRELYADEMLRLVINGTGLRKYRGDRQRSPADIARSVKIMEDHAAAVAKRGGGLHELVRYLEALTDEKDMPGAAASCDSVRLMTVHHSKGLEFPVCFLCECASDLSRKRSSGGMTLAGGNIAFKLYDGGGSVLSKTPLTEALSVSGQLSDIEEEARVLYVALTRARERLIVTCKCQDPDKEVENSMRRARGKASEYDILTAKSMAQWILDALMREPGSRCYEIEKAACDIDAKPLRPVMGKAAESGDSKFDDFFKNCLDFKYEKDYLSNIPAKLTVSKLAPDVLDAADRSALDSSRIFVSKMPDTPPKPRFLSGMRHTPAEAGTATHIFMQFCDWQRLYEQGAAAELERLKGDGFISAENASLVRLDEIETFRSSALLCRLLSARRVLREKRFNAVLDASLFTTDTSLARKLSSDGVKVTVQGVVDCMFTDKDGKNILVDYKTDRLTKEELSDPQKAAETLTERHGRQLRLYRDICRDMLGADFDEVYIYSLHLGDIIPVER